MCVDPPCSLVLRGGCVDLYSGVGLGLSWVEWVASMSELISAFTGRWAIALIAISCGTPLRIEFRTSTNPYA